MTPKEKQLQELQAKIAELQAKKPTTDEVVIKGNRFLKWIYSILFKIFNAIANRYEKKMLAYKDKQFKLKEFNFESPRLILVTFTDILNEQDYEITLHHQTAYQRYYKEYQETNEIPKMIKIDRLIKNNYKTAIKV